MAEHYSDYLKKSVSASDLVFEKISEEDKAVAGKVRKAYIRSNRVFLIIMGILFAVCFYYFVNFLILPPDDVFYYVITLLLFGAGSIFVGYNIYSVIAGIKGIRSGVVLASSREQENKGARNTTYQFLFDIYLEDKDQTLMSYLVEKETFAAVRPGDGVFVAKCGRKVRIFEDPDRKQVMDVSTIKSGI